MSSDGAAHLRPQQRLTAAVFGRVQGVGFRWFVRERAEGLGLVGWVRNRSDGAVELVAEGPAASLERLVDELREGPRGAYVTRVDVAHGPALGAFSMFEIRAGGHLGD
jgi:acylphosphatase